MSRINAASDHLALCELEPAWEHLQQAEALYQKDVWFRWVYYPRLKAEMASYWIMRGDLVQALLHARASLEQAERTLSRKRMAWAHKLLGEIAGLEGRPEDSCREFTAALEILQNHPCPTIEWPILRGAAFAAGALGDNTLRDEFSARARTVVQLLADSVRDDAVRQNFLRSKPIRELLS